MKPLFKAPSREGTEKSPSPLDTWRFFKDFIKGQDGVKKYNSIQ